MNQYMQKRLPGLDSIRFYAAVSVMMYHISLDPKVWFGDDQIASWILLPFLNGHHAVSLFFVLSGFLITYLLLAEYKRNSNIDVGAFYWRRILRIWPLYYTVIALCLIVLPIFFRGQGALPPTDVVSVFGILFFIPNIVYALLWNHVAGHLWSIGVEEQFYIVWPWIVRNIKYLPVILILIMVGRQVAYYLVLNTDYTLLYQVVHSSRFDCMAMGGLGAYLAYRKGILLKVLYHPILQILAVFTFILILMNSYILVGGLSDLVCAAMFMVYIANVSTNPKALFRFDPKWIQPLGNLSYPIYMLHPIVIYIFASLLERDQYFEINMIILCSSVTLLVSTLSFRYMESPFLQMRHRVPNFLKSHKQVST